MPNLYQNVRDTAANWTTNNPTLPQGVLGYETDTLKWKLGDGSTAWNSLGYFTLAEAATILSRLLTVDGASSGLDADLLDGQHGSAYATSGHNHSGTYIDIPANSAQGDILYRDGSGWTRLAAGTSGYALQTNGASANPTWAQKREVLTANRTYYVATTGSDSNDGLAVGTPFATIQKALNVIQANLDVAGYTVTVQLANGTYTENVSCTGFVGGGTVNIKGDETTPSNVVVQASSSFVFWFKPGSPGNYVLSGLKLTNSGGSASACVYSDSPQQNVTVKLVDFGAAGSHIVSYYGARVDLENYTISGASSFSHINCQYGSIIYSSGRTVTITGTPGLNIFANTGINGTVRYTGATFNGSATGKRYSIATNGVINTAGGGSTYFPGDVAGTTATGGQYA